MMTKNDVRNFLTSAHKGAFGVYAVVETQLDGIVSKKSGVTLNIRKVAMWENIKVGVTYDGMVEKKNQSGTTFTSGSMLGFEWVTYPIIKKACKSGVEYASFNYRKSDIRTKVNTRYIVNGIEMTKSEIAALYDSVFTQKGRKEFGSEENLAASTQTSLGISEEDATRVVSYSLESFHYIGTNKSSAEQAFRLA